MEQHEKFRTPFARATVRDISGSNYMEVIFVPNVVTQHC